MPKRKFASTSDQTHNHQATSPTHLALSNPARRHKSRPDCTNLHLPCLLLYSKVCLKRSHKAWHETSINRQKDFKSISMIKYIHICSCEATINLACQDMRQFAFLTLSRMSFKLHTYKVLQPSRDNRGEISCS